MIRLLIDRLEAARSDDVARNLRLDADLLQWLFGLSDFDSMENLLRHCHGLVGNMTGVLALQEDLLPGARLRFETRFGASELAFAGVWTTAGQARPFVGLAPNLANAALAAMLRAVVADAKTTENANDNADARDEAQVLA